MGRLVKPCLKTSLIMLPCMFDPEHIPLSHKDFDTRKHF